MDEALRVAGERFIRATRTQNAEGDPHTRASLAAVESYLGQSVPEPWRTFLTTFGTGSPRIRYAWPDASGVMVVGTDDASEHQVETDDGRAIAAAGGHVIAYIEGVGDCIVLDADGTVQHHCHSGDDHPLGTLVEFIDELAQRLETTTA